MLSEMGNLGGSLGKQRLNTIMLFVSGTFIVETLREGRLFMDSLKIDTMNDPLINIVLL